MTTIIASKSIKVTIGVQDWSDWISQFTTGYAELDDGTIETQATLTLNLPANFGVLPSDPRYETNPTQWARGQSVQIQALNDSGVFVNHPCGKLFIVEEPEAAQINSDYTLSLGCALLLNNFRQPDGDLSSVTIGVSTPRATVIGNLLDAALVPHSLTSMGNPFDYPVPKRGGSYVEQAGVLARASNQVIYCDRTGTAKNTPIDFNQAAIATFVIGEDESLWEPSKGSEIPVEELCVSATTYDLIDPNTGSTTFIEIMGTKGDIIPTDGRPHDPIIVERQTITDYGYNPGTGIQRTVIEIEKPEAAIKPYVQAAFSVGVDPFRLTTASIQDTQITFDAKGRYLRETITYQEPQYTVNSKDKTFLLVNPSKQEIADYTYTSDEVVESITKTEKDCAVRIDPTQVLGVYALKFRSSTKQEWLDRPAKSGIYEYRETNKLAQVLATGAPTGSNVVFDAFKPVKDPNNKDIFKRGSSSEAIPPSVQYRNPDRNQKERHIKSCCHFLPLAGAGFSERKRSITIDGATSEAQLYDYGITFNRLIVGRRLGRRIGFRISDLWLSSAVRPLLRIDVMFEGATYKLLIDGLTYSHTLTEAYVVANCILIESNGVAVIKPVLAARINAVCGECTAAIALETSGNVLDAVCGKCTAAISVRQLDRPGVIDSRFNKPENSITLGVV